jgi:hypothetical protein
MKHIRQGIGWLAVGLSTLLTTFWAFWGIIENFHEGWYAPSLLINLALMICQYLLLMLLFMGGALAGIYWPRLGGALHVLAALFAAWFFRGSGWIVVYLSISVPLILIGVLYWCGRPEPRRWATLLIISVPLLTLVIWGAEPILRVAGRIDDRNRDARHVEGNDVDLIWAPQGPGWPKVIYWWTATDVDDKTALIIVYNGQVWPRPKRAQWGYLGFRAVKNVRLNG